MDLIYTDANCVDQGVLSVYAFDLSFGSSENDFEITIGKAEATLEYGAFIYMEGTEYGGIVDAKKSCTKDDMVTYMGRTWHGILNSKVIEPNAGYDYYSVSGDARDITSYLLTRLNLRELFTVPDDKSGIEIDYQFHRYCKGYDGITKMLASSGAKLKVEWKDKKVLLTAVPIVDYTTAPVDGDSAVLTVEKHEKKVNHLICLGRGELAEREVIRLYSDADGNVGDTQYFTGLDEVTDTYDNSNSEDLRTDGIRKFKELLASDKAEISLLEDGVAEYDIGDIVGAMDIESGVTVSATVSQKIVRISNGAVSTEYKTGS